MYFNLSLPAFKQQCELCPFKFWITIRAYNNERYTFRWVRWILSCSESSSRLNTLSKSGTKTHIHIDCVQTNLSTFKLIECATLYAQPNRSCHRYHSISLTKHFDHTSPVHSIRMRARTHTRRGIGKKAERWSLCETNSVAARLVTGICHNSSQFSSWTTWIPHH